MLQFLIHGNVAYIAGFMGQSNTAGMEGEEGDLIASWQGPQPNILIGNYGTYPGSTTITNPFDFVPMEPGVTAWSVWSNTPVGPEQGFMHAVQSHFNTKVFLSKLAFGGYTIEEWLPGGNFRDILQQLVTDQEAWLTARGYQIKYLPMIWGQGESNAGDSSATYQAKLEQLIDYYRTLSPLTAVQPWILQKISTYQTSINGTTVNAGMDAVKLSRSLVDVMNPSGISGINADDVSAPGVHYPLTDLVTIGQAHFDLALANNWI